MVAQTGWPSVPVICCLHGTAARGGEAYASRWSELRPQDTLIVNCRADLSVLQAFPPGPRVAVLPLAVDGTRFGVGGSRHKRPERSVVRAGFVGRLLPQRNLHRAIDAVRTLNAQGHHIEFDVVGPPCSYRYLDWYDSQAYMQFLAQQADAPELRGRVRFYGSIDNDAELRDAYESWDFLIHPSTVVDENFGYVPVEAALCGTATVGTRWGGLRDWLHRSRGRSVPCWSTRSGVRFSQRELVRAIRSCSRGEASELGESARSFALRNYGVAAFDENLGAIIREAVLPPTPQSSHASLPSTIEGNSVRDLISVSPQWDALYAHLEAYGSHRMELRDTGDIQLDLPFMSEVRGSGIECRDPAWQFSANLASATTALFHRLARAPVGLAEATELIRKAPEDSCPSSILRDLLAAGVLVPEASALPGERLTDI
ncbi:MAG: glycosyltransferase family 4 protein [Candidatus Thiodiazotropha sp.]